jgi:hypothetical protein
MGEREGKSGIILYIKAVRCYSRLRSAIKRYSRNDALLRERERERERENVFCENRNAYFYAPIPLGRAWRVPLRLFM